MKKFLFGLTTCAITLTASFACTTALASSSVVESPAVKIVIDGKTGTYTNTPIISEGRTLLPLREVLTNLGVKNEEIKWNDSDKSIRISKDSTTIDLKINDKNGSVNGEKIDIEVPPMIYNDSTYIPVRFVSQSLGKKVVWDGSTTSVLIRDEKDYNEVKDLLEKSNKASESIEKMKIKMNADYDIFSDGKNSKMTAVIDSETNTKTLAMHMNMTMNTDGKDIVTETYYCDSAIYMKNPLDGKWMKTPLEIGDYEKIIKDQGKSFSLKATEAMCAGLVIKESANPNEIILSGDVYIDELFKNISTSTSANTTKIGLDKFNIEMSIDKETYLPKGIAMKMAINMGVGSESAKMNISAKGTYSDYNGDFDVTLPDSIKNSATEMKMN